MMNTCTTCLLKDDHLVSINENLLQVIANVLQPTTINISNLLTPQTKICFGCKARLHDMLNFRATALKSLELLSNVEVITPDDHQQSGNTQKTKPDMHYIYSHTIRNMTPYENYSSNSPEERYVIETLGESSENTETLADPLGTSGIENKSLQFDTQERSRVHTTEMTMKCQPYYSVDIGKSLSIVPETMTCNENANPMPKKRVRLNKPFMSQKVPIVRVVPPANLIGCKTEGQPTASDHNYSDTVIAEETEDATKSNSLDEGGPSTRRRRNTEQLWYIKSLSNDEILTKMEEKRRKPEFRTAPYKCKLCVIVFRDKPQMKSHLKDCHDETKGRFSCFICTRRFLTMAQMNRHISLHCSHVYVCAKCSFDTYDKRVIQRHLCNAYIGMRKAKVLKPRKRMVPKPMSDKLECELCQKTFKTRSGFTLHMDLCHKYQPREQCKICNRSYKHHYSLKNHMNLAHSNKPKKEPETYYCELCDYTFTSANTYKFHLRSSQKHVNKDDFKFACDQCDFKFFYKRLLEEHITVVHLKQKPYKCELCDKTFSKKRGLKNHVESFHEHKVKPRLWKCTTCDDAFYTRKILQQHERRHTGDRPFHCQLCQSTFSHSGAFHTHKRLRHGITSTKLENPSVNAVDPSANAINPSANSVNPSVNVNPSANAVNPSVNVNTSVNANPSMNLKFEPI